MRRPCSRPPVALPSAVSSITFGREQHYRRPRIDNLLSKKERNLVVSSTHDATRFPLSAIRPAWNAYDVITYGVGIFIDESSTHFFVYKHYAFVIRKQKLIFVDI